MALPTLSGRLEQKAWLGRMLGLHGSALPFSVTLDEALPALAFSFHVCAMWGDRVTPDKTVSIREDPGVLGWGWGGREEGENLPLHKQADQRPWDQNASRFESWTHNLLAV